MAQSVLLLCMVWLGQWFARSSNISDFQSAISTNSSNSYASLPTVLRIGAFDIKSFSSTKMGDHFKANIIRDIVKRYDVILIQEIRDVSGEALQQLWDMVGRSQYSLVYSERLGRSSYKEQYAYFCNRSTVEVVGVHQYDDRPDDPFEREPFVVKLKPIGGSWNIAVIGIHVKAAAAVSEINELYTVYNDVRNHWKDVQDVVIMGDLYAACSYVQKSDLIGMPIYNKTQFLWLLDADTPTSINTDCAYDRFVISGPNIQSAYIPGSEGIYPYEYAHNLSYDEMLGISDHYPIELEIC